MLRVVAAVAVFALAVYCVIDAVQTPEEQVRGLPKPMWVLVTLLFPLVGGIAWLVAGRPVSIIDTIVNGRGKGGPRGPLGPDDDPDFLKGL